MSKFIISLGIVNKKLFLPLIYLIVYSLINIFYFYNVNDLVSVYLDGFGFSTGQILTYFFSNLIRYTQITTKNKKKSKRQNFIKDYFFLFLIDVFYMVNNLLPYLLTSINEKEGDTSFTLYINDAIQIVFLTLITYFLVNYKYYIHHFISLAIFVILSAIIDLILGNYTHAQISTLFISMSYIFAISLIYSYFKYLIEKKYYFFMDVLLMLGIINFIVFFISLMIFIIVHKANGTNIILFQFYNYYIERGIGYIIIRFFFGLICIGILAGTLEFAILNELTPNYIIIIFGLSKIPTTLMGMEGNIKWAILVISIFQIFSLLFYLEILEFNFCSLNKNTKKNIISRVLTGTGEDNDNSITLDEYDITENFKKQETEMEEVNEEEEQKEDQNINNTNN